MFLQNKKFIPYNSKLNSRARELRNNMTMAENRLWFGYLRGCKYRFVRQKVVGNYIIDFYCQKLKLGIEIDGETHFGKRNEEHDRIRTKELEILGIRILRFWNKDVIEGLSEVENIIENNLTPLIPLCKGDKKTVCK